MTGEEIPLDDEFLAWLDIRMSEQYWIGRNTDVADGKGGDNELQRFRSSTDRTG